MKMPKTLRPRLTEGLYPVSLNLIEMQEMPHDGRRFINIHMTVRSGVQEGRNLMLRAYDPYVVTILAAELGVTIPEDIKIEQIARLFNETTTSYVCEVRTRRANGFAYEIPVGVHPSETV